jgi:hypothetical protein
MSPSFTSIVIDLVAEFFGYVSSRLGEIFSWSKIPFSPYSNIIGGIVLAGAWMFHEYCHRAHRKIHQQSSSIDSLTCPEYGILMVVNDMARKGGYYNVYSNCHGIRSKGKRTSP